MIMMNVFYERLLYVHRYLTEVIDFKRIDIMENLTYLENVSPYKYIVPQKSSTGS